MPKLTYDHHVFICTNRRPTGHQRGCCASKGSEKLRDYMKARVKELGLPATRINTSGCLDQCEQGPAMVIYPEGAWYRMASTADVDAVIESHLQKRRPVEALRIIPVLK